MMEESRTAQLRLYTIAPGRLDDFVREWARLVVPLRRVFGFRVEAAWADGERGLFGWLVTYVGDGSFEEADAAYYASAERAAMSPDPADMIVAKDTRFVAALRIVSDPDGEPAGGP